MTTSSTKSVSSTLAASFFVVASLLHTVTRAEQPPRWVTADDVRVRQGPDTDKKVVGVLRRGSTLILKDAIEHGGFCLIEGEGQYGYVACKYLSAQYVPRAKAGEAGVDAAQRWVGGTALTLREAAQPDARVIKSLALNTVVKLVLEEAGKPYCEVQLADGTRGYTACRYLVSTPIVVAQVQGVYYGDGPRPANYDPVKAFWLDPGWQALEAYANYLKERRPEPGAAGPWPRDEALEKMKAHLALGLKGKKPEPYADWAEIKRKAAQEHDFKMASYRLRLEKKTVPPAVSEREQRIESIAEELRTTTGLWDIGNANDDGDMGRIFRLLRALEFAEVRPSFFRSDAELAPPGEMAEQASGRFNIIFRQLTTPRRPPKKAEEGYQAGLYDMLSRTQILVRPVQRVQLFRDGRLAGKASLMRGEETLWRDVEEEMCAGFVPGFALGESDKAIWRYFDTSGDTKEFIRRGMAANAKNNPPGSLYAFYTTATLPAEIAKVTEKPIKLNREKTGFIRGTYLHYDLDGDGIADIAIWEGEGFGPGHLGGTTTTDDRWYRLVLANINGAWKVLGSDRFQYGCGC
ncbi:SH3 domain-containing protein [Undibacterium pigrum]|nr:SH3 domain-containing protein [Undibacterium pigrum]